MNISDKGRRIPRRKAYSNEAKILAEKLIQWMEKFTAILVSSHTLVAKKYQDICLVCCESLYYDTYNDTEKLIKMNWNTNTESISVSYYIETFRMFFT